MAPQGAAKKGAQRKRERGVDAGKYKAVADTKVACRHMHDAAGPSVRIESSQGLSVLYIRQQKGTQPAASRALVQTGKQQCCGRGWQDARKRVWVALFCPFQVASQSMVLERFPRKRHCKSSQKWDVENGALGDVSVTVVSV